MARLTWHGHATFSLLTDSGHRLLFDPYLDENPAADISAADITDLDFILCSHGHFDHFADAIPLALRTGAQLIGPFELVGFAQTQGVQNTHAMHIGGGHRFPFGWVKLTPAMHGGQIHGDAEGAYTTHPCGYWIDMDGKRLYYSGDTALLMDMQLLRGQVDLAVLPIGDNFTMGPTDAARAVEFIQPGVVIPIHYNTWDVIAQDPAAFAARIAPTRTIVLRPGESHEF